MKDGWLSRTDHILDFQDKDKKRFVWPKELYDEHSPRHPELKEYGFIASVKTLICNPDWIYPAYNKKGRYCFYLEQITRIVSAKKRYTKVVVSFDKNVYIIISAFKTTEIKEIKYHLKPLCNRP